MQTITVTIGRNVGDEPLPQEIWNDFGRKVRDVVETYTNELWTVAPYKGGWQGIPEEAMIFYGPADDDINLQALRASLSTIATYYRQDAIGLSVGESELVESFAALATATQ